MASGSAQAQVLTAGSPTQFVSGESTCAGSTEMDARELMNSPTHQCQARSVPFLRSVLVWLLATMLAACAIPDAIRAGSAPSPLIIEEQGSFATGGTVITAPGTFD